MYKTPYETAKEKDAALTQLQREYEAELAEDEWLDQLGYPQDDPPELKTRGKDRKG